MNSLRTYIIIILVAFGTVALTGCAKKALECDSHDAKELVEQIIKEQYSLVLANKRDLNFNVVKMRTLSFNKDIGSYQCAADIEITGQNEIATGTLIFTQRSGHPIKLHLPSFQIQWEISNSMRNVF